MKQPAQTSSCHLYIAAQLTPQPPCGRFVGTDEHRLTQHTARRVLVMAQCNSSIAAHVNQSMYTLLAHVLNATTNQLCPAHNAIRSHKCMSSQCACASTCIDTHQHKKSTINLTLAEIQSHEHTTHHRDLHPAIHHICLCRRTIHVR